MIFVSSFLLNCWINLNFFIGQCTWSLNYSSASFLDWDLLISCHAQAWEASFYKALLIFLVIWIVDRCYALLTYLWRTEYGEFWVFVSIQLLNFLTIFKKFFLLSFWYILIYQSIWFGWNWSTIKVAKELSWFDIIETLQNSI